MDLRPMTTRRSFLRNGMTLVGAASTVPLFMDQTARVLAAGAPGKRGAGDPVLVVVQLAGGNDGLNTIVPITNDDYYRQRPKLGIPKAQTLKLTDELGFHPALTGFKELHDEGLLAVVQGVGYPNPNRSHFHSMDIWHTGSPDGRLHSGWIGRYFDNTCSGSDGCAPEAGVAVMGESPLAMRGDKFAPVSFQRPEQLTWQPAPGGGMARGRMNRRGSGGMQPNVSVEAFDTLNRPPKQGKSQTDELAYLQRTALDARLSAADIQQAARGSTPVAYPNNPLAASLKTVARMISAGMPTRIYYASHGGFDTHSGQLNRHQQLLSQTGDALAAFMKDLAATRQLDRVMVMTFSEFGRRVSENASGGTDHGEAAPMFVLGKHVKPGVLGTTPDLSTDKLHRGDVPWTTDFREVYAALLQNWLKTDSRKILGGAFEPLPVVGKA